MFVYKIGQVYIHKNDKKGFSKENKYSTIRVLETDNTWTKFGIWAYNSHTGMVNVSTKVVKTAFQNNSWKLCPIHNSPLGKKLVGN